MRTRESFTLEADAAARRWLDIHPSTRPRIIAYEAHRCCGGGVICRVSVREMSRKDGPRHYATGVLEGGETFLIDPRAAARLPSRFGLTVRGPGPLKHLDLELDGEQWGELLYSRP